MRIRHPELNYNTEEVELIRAMFRIRIDLNTDPDPAFQVSMDPDLDRAPDSDQGFFMVKM